MSKASTVIEASKLLLFETCSLLNSLEARYLVVGGWSPYLLNKTSIKHPGTKDVDILFQDATIEYGIKEIFQEFLAAGFMVSAKHDFQLLKVIEVNNQQLVFNVDFLHPSETSKSPKLFVDQLTLGVLERPFGPEKANKSIALPSSKMFFDGPFGETHQMEAAYLPKPVEFPLLTAIGCVLSKCVSVSNAKRHRDAFDIYLSLLNTSPEDFASVVRPFEKRGVEALLGKLSQYLEQASENNAGVLTFDHNVGLFTEIGLNEPKPSEVARQAINAV